MFGRFKIKRQRRRIVWEDRRDLEARVRRFLSDYRSAAGRQKNRYYDVVAGASAACHPENALSCSESLRVAEMTAEAATAVVRRRTRVRKNNADNPLGHLSIPTAHLDGFITDAYATAAVAYRHAAGVYVDDERMQSLGTDAGHLLTMAVSRATSKYGSPEGCSPPWQRLAQSVAEPSSKNS